MTRKITKLPTTAQKWLRTFHLYLACTWGGGAASLFAIHCLYRPGPGPELHARNLALLYVDTYILMPSAVGCLLSGLLYCQLSKWGYVKYYWIIGKLIANLGFLFAGFFWFVPLIHRMVNSSWTMDRYRETDPAFTSTMHLHMAMIAAQALLVFVVILISVFKPWGRTHLNWWQRLKVIFRRRVHA